MAFKKVDWDKVEMKRVNIRVTPAVDSYFNQKSKLTGLSKSSLMYMALENYIIQSNSLLDKENNSASGDDSDPIDEADKESILESIND